MAYNELIKNFDRIRDYMREFYVFGFKSRDEYNKKSARSYDDERRRIESWLGDYMGFRQTPDGKNVFISIDSRITHHNPLYKAWKAKSFTDGDITLHFAILDILASSDTKLTAGQITETIDKKYLSIFLDPKLFDESTVRKKLKEYVSDGLLKSERAGKSVVYYRAEDNETDCADALDFFSEVSPCGVVGSYLLDRIDAHDELFAFKHHYITQALDSEVLCAIFMAMQEKREITITNLSRRANEPKDIALLPIKVLCSVQSGRQYLLGYQRRSRRIKSFRIDYILSAEPGEVAADFDTWREKLNGMRKHMWGVSTQGRSGRTEHVEFTVRYADDETHIYNRMLREKRCGEVEKIDDNSCRFSAEVYDTNEMIPWIRTFICRITEINFSNKEIESQFLRDLEDMYRLYELNGGVAE